MKKFIKDTFGLIISGTFFYFTFTEFLYTLFFIISIIIFLGLHVYYVVWKTRNSLLINSFKNNSEYAKAMFRWNLLARRIFEIALNKQDTKDDEKVKDCYDVLKVNIYAKKKEIKEAWKYLAKKYHPDNYQDDDNKKEAEELFKRVTDCKDKLIRKINV